MNPVLIDIYSTVAPSMPFIIAAYAIVWLALLLYVIKVVRGLKKTEAKMALLEEAIRMRQQETPCMQQDTRTPDEREGVDGTPLDLT